MHRYMVNQQEPPFKSIVPMIQVSWNLMWFFLQQEEGAGGSEGGGGGGGETFGGSDGRPSGDEETGVARAPVSQGSCRAVYGDHKKNNVATPLKKKNAKTFFFTPHYKWVSQTTCYVFLRSWRLKLAIFGFFSVTTHSMLYWLHPFLFFIHPSEIFWVRCCRCCKRTWGGWIRWWRSVPGWEGRS